MSFLTGSFSLRDERSWGSDSALRSSLYRVELGFVAFGQVGGIDFDDWYALDLPGPGTYRLSISNDPVNNYAGNVWTGSSVTAQMTDAFGLSVLAISSATAFGVADGTTSFTYSGSATFSDYYIRVNTLGSTTDYALKLELIGGITSSGGSGNDTLTGSSMDDSLSGLAGDDSIDGYGGNDTLRGGAGDDTLWGGTGDDLIDGGDNLDVVWFWNAPSGVVANLASGAASGGTGNDTLVGIEDVWGSDFGDTITGNSAANYIDGNAGNDSIVGGIGNDVLRGDLGNDTLDGGDGSDSVFFDSTRANATVTYNAGLAQFTVSSATDGTDIVRNVETLYFNGVAYSAGSLINADTIPGSSATTAVVLVNGSLGSALDSAGDSDWVAITLVAGTAYQFDLFGAPADGGGALGLTLNDPLLVLRNSAGTQLASNDDGGNGLNSRLYHTPSAGGTYYLDVQASGGTGTGTWRLFAYTATVSGNLSVGGSTSGSIDPIGDIDDYTVDLVAGVSYVVTLSGGTLADPFLEVSDPAGLVVIYDDDSGDGFDAQLTYTPVTSGRYFLTARESGNNATGSYTLSVAADTVPGNTTSAVVVTVGSAVDSAIDYPDDSDYFRIQLVAGTTYQFDLLGSAADGGSRTLYDPWLALANAAGTVLASNDDSGIVFNSRITYTPTASGTYFLIAEESGYDDTGSYRLLVNSTPVVGTVSVGTPRSGSVDFTGDVDIYTLSLVAGTTYRLSLQGNTLAHPFLELLDATGAVVDFEDSGSGNRAQFDFTPTTSGNYQLLARESGHDATGSYTLTVAFPDSVPGDLSSQSSLYSGKGDGSVSSSIDFAGDTDWWRATLATGYGYQIWLEGDSAGLGTLGDPYLRLLNGAGVQQQFNNDLGAGTFDAYLYAVPSVGGTYFVSAEEFGHNATGTYTLTLWRDALASTASATTVGVNSYYDERIGWMDDTSDWIAVTLSSGMTYQFDLIGSDGDGSAAGRTLADPWLKLRNSAGALLDDDDDSGLLSNARIVFTPSTGGTYFLESYMPPGGDDSGTYRLIVNALPAITPLVPGVPVGDELNFEGDVDQFSITLTAGITYTFTLAGNTLGDPFLELLDSQRAVLTSDDDSGDGLDARLTYTPTETGTYYVSARASAHLSKGTYTVSVSASGVAAGAFESESNNSSSLADSLTLNTRLSGVLADRDDDDWYQFSVGAAGTLAIELDVPTNSSLDYFRIGVWDSANHRLANFVTGSDRTYQVSAPAAGSYYVVVDSPQYHSSGSYGLKVTHTAGGSGIESEPNEVYANSLLSGSAIAGQLAIATDVDWFYLAITAPSELALVFDAPTSSTLTDYFQIRVLDAAGNLLASRNSGSDFDFGLAAPADGTYFVAVSTASGSAHDTGTYRLTLTASASSTLREVEPNNAPAQANALPLPGAIKGQLSSSADADGYLVTTTGAGTLSLRLDAPTASTWGSYFRVTVYAPDGSLLASRDTGGDTAFDVEVSAAGSHRVVIGAATLYSGGEYELSVSAVANDNTPAGAIQGTPAADTLVGTAGPDTIAGLGGNDLIDGGTGSDTAFFRTALANLSINTIEGLTAVRGNNAAGEHAFSVSRLWNVERISTSGGLTVLGNANASPRLGTAQADQITGTAGTDLVDGLGGSDFVDGGAGSDTLVLFGPPAAFNVQTIAGITRIRGDDSTFEYAGHTIRTVNVERLAFTQNQSRTLEVTATNKLFGSAGADTLIGTGAADVIDGLGGNDSIDGGAGSDTLVFFGRRDEFTIAFPSSSDGAVRVTGKSGDYQGQTVRAVNVESLAFSDGVVGVTNPPGVVATPATTLIAEGGSPATLAISLKTAPSANVTVRLAGGTQLDASVATLTFTSANWNQAQSVNVGAKDDSAAEKQHAGTLTISVESTDTLYAGIAPSTIDYTITDNDSPGLGAVAGRLWNDADRDGTLDAGEAPLVSWRVFDDVNRNGGLDSGEAFVVTDTSGAYRLNDLGAGTHVIVARPEPGWVATSPGGGSSVSSSVIQNQAGSGFDGIGWSEPAGAGLDPLALTADYTNLGSATRIADFHADPRFAGIQGRGYAVVVIDTGADLDHADFGPDGNGDGVADRIVYQFDFSGANDPSAADTNGHGTHVAGTIGSSDAAFPGIAAEASLIVLKVSPDNSNSMSRDDVREALNWVVQNHAQYNVVAVNLSLGGSEFHRVATTGWYSSQIYALTAAGVTVVAASGNSYDDNPVQGVAYPSSDPYALSVGAVWAVPGTWGNLQTGVTDAIVVFSQRDDSESDVFAPGGHVVATKLGGGHIEMSGTSMASPQIAGMVALAQQVADQYLGRRLTFFELRELLQASGDAIVDGDDENDTVANTGLTFKRVDMVSLAEAVLALKPPTSHTVAVTAGNTVADRNFGFTASAVVQGLADDDLIAGTYLGDILRGGAGNDRIDAGADNDAIYGEVGDDDLTPGTGDDLVDGGEGTDRAMYLARRDTFTVSYDSASSTYTLFSAATGRDQVRAVEFFEFSNGTIAAAQLIDSTAPMLASTIPADGATTVATAANLVLTFNEQVEWGSAAIVLKTAAGVTVEEFNAASPAARASLSGAVLTLDPSAALVAGTAYRLEIAAGALKDLAGNPIVANDSYDFTAASSANAAPTSSNGSANVAEDGTLAGTLPAASDANGDTISYAKAGDPAHGTLTVNTNGGFSYRPAANYHGSDSFGFRVSDPGGLFNSYTMTITVTAVNDPVTGSVTVLGTPRVGAALAFLSTLTDADGLGSFGFQWLRGGAAIGGATSSSFTPVAADVGATLALRVSFTDGGGSIESATSAATAAVLAAVNVITGSADNNTLLGSNGADSILGLGGNDVLNGGGGSDTLDGGAGFDLVSYGPTSGSTSINVNWPAGLVTQGSDTDTLIGVEALFGSKLADTIRAFDGVDTQRGETIRGGQGGDTIDGGTGVDMAEFNGARAGYTVTRTGNQIIVADSNGLDGNEGIDTLTNVERLLFNDKLLAFGTRAEEIARVAFVLWTPGIVGSSALFARGYSYYDNGGYDFESMCSTALLFHDEQGLAFAQKLKANMPGSSLTVDQIFATMNNAGGGQAGRVAAVIQMTNDAATETAIAASNIRTSGVVADLEVQGFGTLFSLWTGG